MAARKPPAFRYRARPGQRHDRKPGWLLITAEVIGTAKHRPAGGHLVDLGDHLGQAPGDREDVAQVGRRDQATYLRGGGNQVQRTTSEACALLQPQEQAQAGTVAEPQAGQVQDEVAATSSSPARVTVTRYPRERIFQIICFPIVRLRRSRPSQ
jgi:hypothetical protein